MSDKVISIGDPNRISFGWDENIETDNRDESETWVKTPEMPGATIALSVAFCQEIVENALDNAGYENEPKVIEAYNTIRDLLAMPLRKPNDNWLPGDQSKADEPYKNPSKVRGQHKKVE